MLLTNVLPKDKFNGRYQTALSIHFITEMTRISAKSLLIAPID